MKDAGRLGWLFASLAGHRGRIIALLGRLTDLGTLQGMTPKVFQRFAAMLDQIAAEKDKELSIINQIEAVERQHKHRRKHQQLVTNTGAPKLSHLADVDLMTEKPRKGGLLLYWLLLLGLQSGNNQQKQQFKVG